MIRVQCLNCSSLFDTDERYAGMTANCPNCQAQIVIPAASSSVTPQVQQQRITSSAAGADNLPQGHGGISIAGFVCGIVAIVISFIPCMGLLALGPALAGIICSIIGLVKAKSRNRKKGLAIAGLICSVLAVIWIPLYIFVFVGGTAALFSAPHW
jgi:DNA-directed RNA polymerase subunit RPC12/RpoP